jgi:hypothetical protein
MGRLRGLLRHFGEEGEEGRGVGEKDEKER